MTSGSNLLLCTELMPTGSVCRIILHLGYYPRKYEGVWAAEYVGPWDRIIVKVIFSYLCHCHMPCQQDCMKVQLHEKVYKGTIERMYEYIMMTCKKCNVATFVMNHSME